MSKRPKKQQPVLEPIIYIGPSLPNGRLAQNTVFKAGIPLYLKDLCAGIPDFELLFVPVSKMHEGRKVISRLGTPQQAVYERLSKGV